MTAPMNATSAYERIVEALAKEIAQPNAPETPTWLGTAERLVTVVEALVAVPEVPTTLPNVLGTAQAMLERVVQHAAAADGATVNRWLGHLEQLVALTRRMAAMR